MSNRTATSKVKLTFEAVLRNVLDDSSPVVATHADAALISLAIADGIDAGQANRAWARTKTLSAGATETLDLYTFSGIDIGGGTGADALGQTLLMEEVVTYVVKNKNTEAQGGFLEIEQGAGDGLTSLGNHTVANLGALGPLGVLLKHQPGGAGFNLSATNKQLKITAVGAAITYTIMLLGRHDDDASSSSSSSSTSSRSSSSTSSLSSSSSQSTPSSLSSSTTSSLSTSSLSSSSTSSLSSSSTSSLSTSTLSSSSTSTASSSSSS